MEAAAGGRSEEGTFHRVICCVHLDLCALAFLLESVAEHPQDIEKTHMEQNFLFPFGLSVSGLIHTVLLRNWASRFPLPRW